MDNETLDLNELVNWARNLLEAARRGENSDDKLEALRFLRLATVVCDLGKVKSIRQLEFLTSFKWIRARALKSDALGYLCDDFLNCYGLKK